MSRIAEAILRKQSQLPQFEYLWRIELPDISSRGRGIDVETPTVVTKNQPAGYVPNMERSGGSSDGFDMAELSHRVTSVDLPMPSIETAKNTAGSRYVYTASNHDIGSMSIKMDEMEDGMSLDYLTSWQQLVVRSDGFHNPPAIYKRDIKVIRMTSTELDIHVSIFHGAFPTEISPIGYNYESNSILQYSVTLAGDKVSHIIIPADQVRSMVASQQEEITRGNTITGTDLGSRGEIMASGSSLINTDLINRAIQASGSVAKGSVNKVKSFF